MDIFLNVNYFVKMSIRENIFIFNNKYDNALYTTKHLLYLYAYKYVYDI